MQSVTPKYIDLLNEAAEAGREEYLLKSDAHVPGAELIEAGFLIGHVETGSQNEIIGVIVMGVSLQGRMFVDELVKERDDRTAWGKAKKAMGQAQGFIVGIVAGIITAIATAWALNLLGPAAN